ncbi:phosphoribosylaminoimidazole carboxylase catalytic subunit [Gordonia sputi NBRC 100414]|uniref:N5-carboxyaminoimidazole ribonucleotide mutase n=1 Tax=Gordonia sputi NBRC 100414 TaxID=1089453 RepID=H5U0G6_9ACTN|nr:phosphoribosylaminoimidazole carboxylase catalytic subunit [Gordonia sputi NBRC 100414]
MNDESVNDETVNDETTGDLVDHETDTTEAGATETAAAEAGTTETGTTQAGATSAPDVAGESGAAPESDTATEAGAAFETGTAFEAEPASPPIRSRARVGLIMGSDSDWPTMEAAAEALAEFDVPFEVGVVSAHRTPQRMLDYAKSAAGEGIEVIIAGAGGAAHLPGMVAAATPLPVIGVPVPLRYLDGMDSLLSIVQMPAGVPVATVSVGGARNAGLLAVRILGSSDPVLRARMEAFQRGLEQLVLDKDAALRQRLLGGD